MQADRIGLHMHSFYSNGGECSPQELIGRCLENGIRVTAIVDHDSVRVSEQGKEAAGDMGITYIPVVEVDCAYERVNSHMLGYGIDYISLDFAGIKDNISRQGAAAFVKMFHTIRVLRFEVVGEEMAALAGNNYWEDRWAGEMFAEILLDKTEYKEHSMLMPYRQGGERGDNPYMNLYWDYYSQGKPCYVEMRYPGLGQIVEIIHGNGGYAVLAHPGMNLKRYKELSRSLTETGLDGIGAFSSHHSRGQTLDFYDQARNHSLFYTCGSDYYGEIKPSIYIGQHGCVMSYEEVPGQLGGLCQYHKRNMI